MNLNEKEFKTAAKNLKAEVAKLGIDLSHGASLNLLSRALGFRDYNTIVPEMKKYEENSNALANSIINTATLEIATAEEDLEIVLQQLSSSLFDFYKTDVSLKKAEEIEAYAQEAVRLHNEIKKPLNTVMSIHKGSIINTIDLIIDFSHEAKERGLDNEEKFFIFINQELSGHLREAVDCMGLLDDALDEFKMSSDKL